MLATFGLGFTQDSSEDSLPFGSQVKKKKRPLLLALLANNFSPTTIESGLTQKSNCDTLIFGLGLTQINNHRFIFSFGLTQKSCCPSLTVGVGLTNKSSNDSNLGKQRGRLLVLPANQKIPEESVGPSPAARGQHIDVGPTPVNAVKSSHVDSTPSNAVKSHVDTSDTEPLLFKGG